MAGLPDPQRSQAVLIGVGDFEELLPLPTVETNVADLAQALAAPRLWRLPTENISIPRGLTRPFDVKKAVKEAAAKATDTLFVYYGGHGLLDDRGKIHLAIANSTEDAASGVPYTWIHEEVSNSKAARKVIVLDCCYAERALHQAATLELGTENFEIPNSKGMYLFFAATKNQKALVGSGPHTIFTGELLRLLQNGIVSGPEMLTLRDIYDNMLSTFPGREFPEPRLYGDLRSDGVVFGANPAWTPPEPVRPGAGPGAAGPEHGAGPGRGPGSEQQRGEGSQSPDGIITAESLERGLHAEQQAEMRARPSARHRTGRGGGSGEERPQLGIKVLGGDEIRGLFEVRITSRAGLSLDVQLTREVLDRALVAHAEEETGAEPLIQHRRTRTPLLEVLAWALTNKLLPPAGPSLWSPHNIGNGYPPDTDILRAPGRRSGERRVLPTEADRQVSDLIEEEQHVLLLGAGASGKTTIARSQARARGDMRGDGVIWLDLTDPDDGAESVLLTLLGLPEHDRYLLVVDNLQAQAPILRRHPVLDLLPHLTERFGLRLTALATAWPGIERVLDLDEGAPLEPVMTLSLRVINQLLRALPAGDRGAVVDLAEGDIEVALVALDYYRDHGAVPEPRQVAEQLAQNSGANQLADPRQQKLLYWFACLGALEIDIPQRYVASWREQEDRVAVKELLRRELIEPNDEAWSVGNSTRARLLMQYALDHWDSASDFESRGRLVYDHLRRMGPRHIRNTLAQLRLKYDQGQRSELGDLWVQCLDLARRLEVRSETDPTWGGNSLAAAFVAIALGAMDSEYTAGVFATVAPGLDLLDPPVTPSISHGSAVVPSTPGAVARPAGSAPPSLSWPAADPASAADAELGRRLVLGVLLTAEAVAGRPTPARTRRFQKLVRQAAKPSGALGPADAPWVTAMIVGGVIQLQRGRHYENITDAVLWLTRTPEVGGAFRDGWSIGAAGRRWQDFGNPAHLDVFATAHCVKAVHDGSQTSRNRVLRQGLELLRGALPELAEDGSRLAQAAALGTLLHCGEDWHDLAQDLGDLLRWAVLESQDEPEDGSAAALGVVWAASLLLSVIPPIVMRELEPIVNRLLDVDGDDPVDAYAATSDSSAYNPGGRTGAPSAADGTAQERSLTLTEPAPDDDPPADSPLESPSESPSDSAVDAAVESALAAERLEIVKEAAATMRQEIRDQIARRRSILRDMTDTESFQTINGVLTEWQDLKEVLDRAIRDLSIASIDDVVPRINELGLKIYRKSWQDIE